MVGRRILKGLADFSQAPPPDGVPVEIRPGVIWIRLTLPYRLNHVNVYLIDDENGWALLDTGLGNAQTRETWEKLFTSYIDKPLTRIIVTHFHPDHAGMAGWIAERFNLPVYMSETEYLVSRNIHLDPGALQAEHYRKFYMDHGLNAEQTQRVVTQGHSYLKNVWGLPPTFRRLNAGDELAIGHRKFQILTGGGHSPEQVFLYCDEEKLFFAGDQVLNRISPNVSVAAMDPDGNPLGLYLRSLSALSATIPNDVLVLPGHDLPFQKLHSRVEELKAHHEFRCNQIMAACRDSPKSAAELVPYVFHRALDPHEMGFAFSEILAHINYLLHQNALEVMMESIDYIRVSSARVGRDAKR
jgi:glyoxylase-like metal-dependent hydrolase (beta-lactamase superfamily II)